MKWRPVDIIVFMFAAAISAAIVFASYSIAILNTDIADNRRIILEGILLLVMNSVTAYIGYTAGYKKAQKEQDEEK